MSRVAWVFDSYPWAINPNEDGGWIKESILVEQNNIRSRYSVFQHTADKSARRKVQGWIWGSTGAEQLAKMRAWKNTRVRAVLTDHTGESRRCFVGALELTPQQDASEWNKGRQTYKYNIEFIEVE